MEPIIINGGAPAYAYLIRYFHKHFAWEIVSFFRAKTRVCVTKPFRYQQIQMHTYLPTYVYIRIYRNTHRQRQTIHVEKHICTDEWIDM